MDLLPVPNIVPGVPLRVLIPILLGLISGVVALPLTAQAVKEGAPVEVVTKPKVAPPGTPVVVSGHVQVDGKRLGVKFDVSRGDETPGVFATQATPAGDFSFMFKQTQQVGSYRVRILAPDGKGRAETRFVIGSAGAVWDVVDSALRKVADLAASGLNTAEARALAAPASGERTEFLARIKQLDARRASVMGQAQEAFRSFRQGVAQAGIPEVALFGETPGQGPMNDLLGWADESARKSEELKAKLASAGKDSSICDTIQACLEGLNATSLAFSFTTKATGMLLNIAQHRYLLVYTTAVVPVPLFRVFKFPFQNAAFLLSRAMRDPADIAVSGPSGKATIHQTFNRTHTSDKGDIRITWTANVQAEQKF